MSNKKAQSYKKRIKKQSVKKKTQKKRANQYGGSLDGDKRRIVNVSLEEILDRIAVHERNGELTHEQAFKIAEQYANVKPNEVILPQKLYNEWTDNGR